MSLSLDLVEADLDVGVVVDGVPFDVEATGLEEEGRAAGVEVGAVLCGWAVELVRFKVA